MNPTSINILKVQIREFCSSYLKKQQIKDIFTAAKFVTAESDSSVSGERRSLVEAYYASVDWEKPETIQKFLQVIQYALQLYWVNDNGKETLREICQNCGLKIHENGFDILYEGIPIGTDLFSHQFPAGLPFGKLKPDFAIKAEKGGQSLQYELQDGSGIIRGDVYPNYNFKKFEAVLGFNSSTNKSLKIALIDMNQTKHEQDFFIAYAHRFNMAEKDVPLLIPQAWIQWHSQPKRNLRSTSSLHSDELYRVDFVAFWNNKRYAVLVDDISHYAKKQNNLWSADEENYSKRLKEDRKLRKEGWQVFRVSNWELRDEETVQEILNDFQMFLSF